MAHTLLEQIRREEAAVKTTFLRVALTSGFLLAMILVVAIVAVVLLTQR